MKDSQRSPWRFQAITFGHIVLGFSHAVLAQVRAHEHVHVRQYERWGILFFPLYLGSSVWQLLRGRDPNWRNHFEVAAFRNSAPLPSALADAVPQSSALADALGMLKGMRK